MFSDQTAIRVDGLGKKYQIYDHPADRLKQFVAPRLRHLLGMPEKRYFRDFAALQDVSFNVKKGETLGIIGRNGSGKSTLLQIICGTLAPTEGEVEINGKVAALLELGAGFNPEFTGRENVQMNAALLGLSDGQIHDRFQMIVDFADIGAFLEQPVKTYSSGMFVRLAFAVAVHTEPAILVVDEALSVGDIAFQNKCLRRIKEMKDKGTSILFVSHDLSTVQMICDRAIWLQNGKLVEDGDATSVCQEYYAATTSAAAAAGAVKVTDVAKDDAVPQQHTGMAGFRKLRVLEASGASRNVFGIGEDIRLDFELSATEPLDEVVFAVSVYRADGDWMIGQTSREHGIRWPAIAAGSSLSGSLVLTQNCLAPGDYLVAMAAYPPDLQLCYALTDLAASFSVRSSYPTWGKFVHPCEWIDTTSALVHG